MKQKIVQARRIIDESGRNIRLEVDGGVKSHNAREVVDAGADVVVAGSAVFKGEQGVAANVRSFREAWSQFA